LLLDLDFLAFLLLPDIDTIVGVVPGFERCGVDLNNRVLEEGVCSYKLIASSIVVHIENPSLAGDSLASPAEIARVKAHRTILHVASSPSN
jgi:hypothetical protein